MWTLSLGVPIGCKSPQKRGPYSTQIHKFSPYANCTRLLALAVHADCGSDGFTVENIKDDVAEPVQATGVQIGTPNH
jgi:hypothetical protein